MCKHYLLRAVSQPSPSSGPPDALQEAELAVAEALHVDGFFAEAARRWERAARSGDQRAEAALKAAISRISMGHVREGRRWLRQAGQWGADGEEVGYVEAQLHWHRGEIERAIAAFEALTRRYVRKSQAPNALGVLWWQRRDKERARAWFRSALERNPDNAEALANLVSIDLGNGAPPDDAEELLARSALLRPWRPEAYVLHSRLLRHTAGEDAGRVSLVKAQLRRRNLTQPAAGIPIAREEAIDESEPGWDEWLAESLAEYALHVEEDAGRRSGYRAGIIATLPDPQAPGHRKGGFVLSMLRQIMGEAPFDRLLKRTSELSRTHWLDAYTFSALASWIHGQSLFWFFNQWLGAGAGMEFVLDPQAVERRGDGYRLGLSVRGDGIATPGAAVEVEVRTEGGGCERFPVALELGTCSLSVTLPSRPVRVIIDPELRWYAPRTEGRIIDEGVPK